MKKRYFILIIVLILGCFLYLNKHEIYESFYRKEDSLINRLQEKYNNKDVVGLLTIPDTSINEVIVQGSDNDYYLSHDAYKNSNLIGATYLDYRVKINEGRKNLIYSHNSDSLEVPFRELENYYDKDYYLNHQYIYLNEVKYQIFSVFVEVSDWSYMNLNFESDSKWEEHLLSLKEKSWYDTEVDVNKKNQVLILQTCSHHEKYKNYKNKYLLVVAKRV